MTSSTQYSDDGQVVMKTSVDTLLEGYLSDQQSLSRGVKYCYSLLSSHVPSATLLYQLTSKLLCDQLVSIILVSTEHKIRTENARTHVSTRQICSIKYRQSDSSRNVCCSILLLLR